MIELRITIEDTKERDHTEDSDLLMDIIRSELFGNGWVIDEDSFSTTFVHKTGLPGDYCLALQLIADASAQHNGPSVVAGISLTMYSEPSLHDIALLNK